MSSTMDPVVITTDRLTLRLLNTTDAEAVFAIFSDLEVMRYWSGPPMTELNQARALIEYAMEGYLAQTSYRFAIVRNGDAQLVGLCSLFHFNLQCRRAEIGYALGRPFWGAGYMLEALNGLINFAFGALDLIRLEADIDPRNDASAKTLERLGFQREGLMRQRWIVGDEISDTAFYGLLASEWVTT
jgi:[ribosomal protein S5]-alanine N-acetyltransferase